MSAPLSENSNSILSMNSIQCYVAVSRVSERRRLTSYSRRKVILHTLNRSFVEEARANTTDKSAYMKLSVLVMLDKGLTQSEVSILLGISLGTVGNCKKKYESDGLERFLNRHYVPYQGKLSDESLAVLEQAVESGLYSSCAQVGHWVEQNLEVSYTESSIRAILSKLGFVYKKTMVLPEARRG